MLLAMIEFVDQNRDEAEYPTPLVDIFGDGNEDYTVFAPDNEAFTGMFEFVTPSGDFAFTLTLVASQVGDPQDLPPVADQFYQAIANHVITAEIPSGSLSNGQLIDTLASDFDYLVDGNGDQAGLEIEVDNGTIRVAGTVQSGNMGTAPIVTVPDIAADNGILHKTNGVLVDNETFTMLNETRMGIPGDLFDLPGGEFADLVEGIDDLFEDENPLDEVLTGNDLRTLFSPSNDAFTAFYGLLVDADDDTDAINDFEDLFAAVRNLIGNGAGDPADEDVARDALYNLMLYHFVDGAVTSFQLQDGDFLATLADPDAEDGDNFVLAVYIDSSELDLVEATHNEANVVETDRFAPNGVVHFINTVLLDSETASALGL